VLLDRLRSRRMFLLGLEMGDGGIGLTVVQGFLCGEYLRQYGRLCILTFLRRQFGLALLRDSAQNRLASARHMRECLDVGKELIVSRFLMGFGGSLGGSFACI